MLVLIISQRHCAKRKQKDETDNNDDDDSEIIRKKKKNVSLKNKTLINLIIIIKYPIKYFHKSFDVINQEKSSSEC